MKVTLPGQPIPRSFFEHPPDVVAPRLLGKLLVHRTPRAVLTGRIVEVEAYLGPHNDPPDPAAHAHRGPTDRNRVLFGLAGHAYIYFIYGKYFCANISCETPGLAGSILLRALEPLGEPEDAAWKLMARNRGFDAGEMTKSKLARMLTSGPSRMCEAFGITRPNHNGMDLCDEASALQVRDDGCAPLEVVVTPRIGIRHAADWPMRFAAKGHACVTGPKHLR